MGEFGRYKVFEERVRGNIYKMFFSILNFVVRSILVDGLDLVRFFLNFRFLLRKLDSEF